MRKHKNHSLTGSLPSRKHTSGVVFWFFFSGENMGFSTRSPWEKRHSCLLSKRVWGGTDSLPPARGPTQHGPSLDTASTRHECQGIRCRCCNGIVYQAWFVFLFLKAGAVKRNHSMVKERLYAHYSPGYVV